MSQPSVKKFVYYPSPEGEQQQQQQEMSRDAMHKVLMSVAREVLREKTPSLQELEQMLSEMLSKEGINVQDLTEEGSGEEDGIKGEGMPVVKYLQQKGYLKEGGKWLSKAGFMQIGARILRDVMKALKSGELGMHETVKFGSGTTILDTSKKYEIGDDIRLLNVPRSLLNTVERIAKETGGYVKFPLDIRVDDFEEFETIQDVRVAIVYCIDLSSTMRYSSTMGDISRIEAAKRALWSLYVLNTKFFPTDTIYIVGFGALASKVAPQDIPYLKTFEPGHDFLHYTNYQAAFRLASKVLQRDGAINKRIVMVTDGHPSACFVDNDYEKDKILSARPYSHFYRPDKDTLETIRDRQNMSLDLSTGEMVYLCYRYRQVDPYIAVKTVNEAKKCRSAGMDIDTLMVSEEDSLLSFVNDMEKHVKGRSYYINPANLDKVLITDYLLNKKQTVSSRSF